ncbi:MAG: SLC13 family permease [Cyclobacteriaceae bacterium]|nr:SLC13 family permease [Cyclobacteriaceae bacterium]
MSSTYQAYFVIATLVIAFFLIYKEYIRPAIGFVGAVVAFTICGILNSRDVLSGFSNESIASVILLILITAGLRKTFRIESLLDKVFLSVRSYRSFIFRLTGQVALLSSIINNTPVVALLTPYVTEWGKRKNISPSKLLMPLSFAAILGGMITVIGTSTTLVLNGFMTDYGEGGFQAVDLLIIGLCVSVTGIGFMTFFGERLLPDYKKRNLADLSENFREYVVELQTLANSPLIGKEVREAGLRSLKGVYLVEIIRGKRIISPVPPSEVIEAGDALFFAGDTQNVMDLLDKKLGLALPEQAMPFDIDNNEVVEVVLSTNSSIIGKTVKKCKFRNRYNAAIIAIHRNGERIRGKIGDIELQAGDLLMIFAGSDFRDRAEIYRDIYIVTQVKQIVKPGNKKYYALILTAILVCVLLFTGKFSLFPSLLIIISVMAAFSLISAQDVKRELDLNLIIILVFSLAIGHAITKTSAGTMIATAFIDLLAPYGNLSILIGLMLITNILTSFVTNVGAVSIAFPIAYATSSQLGISGYPFYLGVAYTASAAFLTPIGYQTNLIIYGPGNYRFKDFLRLGLPLNIIYFIVVSLCIIALHGKTLLNH